MKNVSNQYAGLKGNKLAIAQHPFLTKYIFPLTLRSLLAWTVYFVSLTLLIPWEFLFSQGWYQTLITIFNDHIPKIGVVSSHSLQPEKSVVILPIVFLEAFIGILLCFYYAAPMRKVIEENYSRLKIFGLIMLSLVLFVLCFYQLINDSFPTGITRRTRLIMEGMIRPNIFVFCFWLMSHFTMMFLYSFLGFFKTLAVVNGEN